MIAIPSIRLRDALVSSALLMAIQLVGSPAIQAASPPATDPTRDIFELSSIRPQLELVGFQLDQWVLFETVNDPPENLGLLRIEISRQYSAGSLEAEILPRMRAKLDRGLAAKALSWLRSPVGKRVNARDTESASAESAERIQLYFEQLGQNPLPPDRRKQIDRLIAATRYNEMSVDIGLAIAQGMVLGMQAIGPAEQRIDPAQVRSQIATTRNDALAESADSSLAGLLYTYRDLSSADLAGFVEFAESEAGRWYHGMLFASALEALDAASLKLQKQVLGEIARREAAGR